MADPSTAFHIGLYGGLAASVCIALMVTVAPSGAVELTRPR